MIKKRKKLLFVAATFFLVGVVCLFVVICEEVIIRIQRIRTLDAQILAIERALKSASQPAPETEADVLENLVRSNATYALDQFAETADIGSIHRPYIEWRSKPGSAGGYDQNNSLGYRGGEFSITKPDNTFRILFYGGSFVWGTGAESQDVTIPAHLERMLNKLSGSQKVEVINCADANYCSTQELIYLLIEGVLLSPDLVIFLDGVNDTAWGYSNLPAGYHGDFHQFNMLLNKQPLKSIFTVHELDHLKREREFLCSLRGSLLLMRIRRLLNPSTRYHGALLNDDTFVRDDSPQHLQLVANHRPPEEFALRHYYNLRSVRALGKEYGFRSIFFTQPVPVVGKPLHVFERETLNKVRHRNRWLHHELAYWEDHYNTYVDSLLSRCDEAGLPLVDLRHLFQDHADPLYIDDCHLTGYGYGLVARRIYQELQHRDLLKE